MAYCAKCLHRDVCQTCQSCDGRVPKCRHFIDREAMARQIDEIRQMLAVVSERLTVGASPCPTERRGNR